MKQIDKFISNIPKLDATQFVGLARILKVPLVTDNPDPAADEKLIARDFADVFEDVLSSYARANRQRRRELSMIVDVAARQNRGDSDASNS